MRSIVSRDTGEGYEAFVKRLAAAFGAPIARWSGCGHLLRHFWASIRPDSSYAPEVNLYAVSWLT